MFDFPVQESSVGTSLYCLFFYTIIFISNYKYVIKNPFKRYVSKNKEKITIFLIGFFLVSHCLQGDFFGLMRRVYEYSSVSGVWNFGEEIYHKIGLAVDKNYLLFRIIVWGGAFTLFCMTAKRMRIPMYYAAVLLLVTHSIIFAYARVTLAMAIYFYGLSFICYPLKSKWISYIIGVCIIIMSMEFHRSAILMIVMTSMIFIPIRKWTIVLTLILLPVFLTLFKDLLVNIALSESTDEVVSQKIQHYSNRDLQQGVSGLIINFLEYISFYIPFFLTAICIFSKKNKGKIPIELYRMFKVSLGFIIVSFIFLLLGTTYMTFSYRILFMSMIPLTLIILKLFQYKLMNIKYYSLCVYSGVSYVVIKYVYTIYCHLV